MKLVIGHLLIGIVVAIGMLSLFGLIQQAVLKGDHYDCLRWQREAGEYDRYYITQLQKEQCDFFEVKIDAPVLQGRSAR